MLRLFLVPLAILLLLVLAAALLIPLLLDKDKLVELASAALHEKTGATLTVGGDARLSLLPTLGVVLSDAAVTLPEEYQAEVRVRALEIGVHLVPLFTGHIDIDTISLDGLDVRIASAQTETGAVTGQPDLAAGAGAALVVPFALDIKNLSVTDSRLEWVDSAAKATVVELVKLQARGLNFQQKPVALELQVRLPGEQPVEVKLAGNIRIDQPTRTIRLDALTTEIRGATEEAVSIQGSGSVDLANHTAELNAEQAHFGKHTVTHLQLRARAEDAVVEVTELTGELHGGALKATATLDSKDAAVTLSTSGSVSGLDIASALAAAQARPIFTGRATLSWQLRTQRHSQDGLTTTLNGPVKLTTEDVVLQGTSVEKLLCQTVALTNKETLTATFPQDTRFANVSADVQVADGKAQLEPLSAALTGITLNGRGSFDLLKQDFTATFKARLSSELEQVDHACRVSKRLTAIDWPVECAGSVGTEPGKWCRVDAEKILQDLAVNEGREKLEKKAGKLLDKLFNRD
jgi:uncharacterized protein involved in outer membrane biogenesis